MRWNGSGSIQADLPDRAYSFGPMRFAMRLSNASAAKEVKSQDGARGESKRLALALLFLSLVLALPYLLGYATTRQGQVYMGLVMNPEDTQSYFAKMLEGYDGAWLYTIPFTAEEHAPAFLGGLYLLLGHLARILGFDLAAMWHLARVLCDALLFLATWHFIGHFRRESRTRWTAFGLAVLGSGLGWLLFLLDQPYWLDAFPVDFKMPEAHLFFMALTYPHVALGTALVLMSFSLTLRAWETGGAGWKYALGAGLSNLGIVIAYPFLIYLVATVLGLFWFLRALLAKRVLWREGYLLALSGLGALPVALYYAHTLATNPVFRAWDAQALTLSPPWPHYLVAYGPLFLLALLVPLARRLRTSNAPQVVPGDSFLWVWLLGAALLAYAPVNAQRRFVQGVQVPLAILAASGFLEVVLPWLFGTGGMRRLLARPRYTTAGMERLLVVALLLIMSLSNGYILASLAVTLTVQQPFPLFRSQTEVEAVTWLRANTGRAAIVLSAYETGNYIAAHAGNRVVLGHWSETPDWETKDREVFEFYSPAADTAWRREFLRQNRVAYIWHGAKERELGAFEPALMSFWQPVYRNEEVTIYRVLDAP